MIVRQTDYETSSTVSAFSLLSMSKNWNNKEDSSSYNSNSPPSSSSYPQAQMSIGSSSTMPASASLSLDFLTSRAATASALGGQAATGGAGTAQGNIGIGGPSKNKFPRKLRRLLNDSEREGNQHIVSWLPHGGAFKVHKPKEFASQIVCRYFNHGQYRSFTRQLYHYGFCTVDYGEDMGAFYHKHFLRDQPALECLIGRTKKEATTASPGNEKSSSSAASDRKDKAREKSKVIKPVESAGKTSAQVFTFPVVAAPTGAPDAADSTSHVGGGITGGMNMLESPFQALSGVGRGSGLLDDVRIEPNNWNLSSIKQTRAGGIDGLLNQLSNEDQDVMQTLFSKKVSSNDNNNDLTKNDEEVAKGLLFGEYNIANQQHNLSSGAKVQQEQEQQPQQPQHPVGESSSTVGDWFASIENHFTDNSFNEEVLGCDLIPRPVEEMMLLEYQAKAKHEEDQSGNNSQR